jgi:hypothetical protein
MNSKNLTFRFVARLNDLSQTLQSKIRSTCTVRMWLSIAFLFGEILPQVLQVLSLSGTIMCALTICFFILSTEVLWNVNAKKNIKQWPKNRGWRVFLFTKSDKCHIALSALEYSSGKSLCAVYKQHWRGNLFRRVHRLCGTNAYDFVVGDILTGYRLWNWWEHKLNLKWNLKE